jgi:hypothetical protein
VASCAPDSDGAGPEGFDEAAELEPGPLLGKDDSAGVPGLPVRGDYSDTMVWRADNRWEDTDTPAAREAGLAWGADSGISWDDKFAAWIGSLGRVPAVGSGDTFELTTPWGKSLPAPKLDCADVAIMLRASFAAWYRLPFFMTSYDRGRRIYFGHFGIRTADGIWNDMPRFAQAYADHSDMSPEAYTAAWPRDETLRRRGVQSGDDQAFLGEGARTGTYLDEIHLNKRAGHFIRLLMIFMGSAHLADSANTFNLVPEALRTGDTLLFRRARNGSGHTMVVVRVAALSGGRLQAEDVYGNLPPDQPVWQDQAATKRNFTNDEGGGPSTNSVGETYSHIGGGLKRWRVAKDVGGRWTNTWMAVDEASWMDDRDYDRIGARPMRFEALLGEVTPEERRDLLISIIEQKRDHLRRYPASCSAREAREQAFEDLYVLMQDELGMTRDAVDVSYRALDDYVFAELDYSMSKTCCWNSSTAAMYRVIMDREEERQSVMCDVPTVFMARGGGYDLFREYALSTGRGDQWVAWSADEACPQAGVLDDVELPHAWTAWCSLGAPVEPPLGCTEDAAEDNDDADSAHPLSPGTFDGATCDGDDDWFSIPGDGRTLAVTLSFDHTRGDLDLELRSAAGDSIAQSTGVSDTERVEAPTTPDETYFVRVYGYSGAEGAYTLTVDLH